MATTIEYLAARIAALEIESAEVKAEYDDLATRHEETMNCYEVYAQAYEILHKYLKPERYLVTAIIDGEDAIKVAKMFHLNLMSIKE